MLGRCRDHARAFCRISIAELRRVAPPAFYVLMVISLLLADGLLPVFASKHRSQGSLYTSSNLARATSGVDNGDDVLYSRSNNNNNNNNNRYRTKVRVKPLVSKKEDSVMSGGADENGNSNVLTDNGNSRLMRPPHSHSKPHVRDVDASEGGSNRRREKERTDNRRIYSGSSDSNLNDHEQLSLHLNEPSSSSSLQSLPSSLSPSTSSRSSLKPSPSLPSLSSSASSYSLTSGSLAISNSSNSIEGIDDPSDATSSENFPDTVKNCLGIHQPVSLPRPDTCQALVSSSQCPVLTAATAEVVCQKCDIQDRISFIQNASLRFCSSFRAGSVSCQSDSQAGCPRIESPSDCLDYLNDIVARDDVVEKMYAGFKDLIGRYDCKTNYSVKWHCHHCQQAYRDWLCSQNIEFWQSGKVVPPCMEFCSHVEEMCPFFRPKLDSYAGDHSFICKDPHMNLPSTMPEENCYRLCDLWPRSEIIDFYCSHANLHGNNCPLLVKSDQACQNTTTSPSNISNNTTSGSSAVTPLSRTPTLSSVILPVFCMLTASLFRLPVTESQYIPQGLT